MDTEVKSAKEVVSLPYSSRAKVGWKSSQSTSEVMVNEDYDNYGEFSTRREQLNRKATVMALASKINNNFGLIQQFSQRTVLIMQLKRTLRQNKSKTPIFIDSNSHKV